MDKNKVRCFVEEYFEEILSAISGRDDFEDLNVVDMGNFDDEFSGNSFKDNYDMVVENEIDIHRDWCMCMVDDEWYGYPSSSRRIYDKYVDVITNQLLNKDYTEWDEIAEYNDIGDDKMCLRKIREEALKPKKFKVNLISVLEEIDVEADDYAEAYDKAISMLSEISRDVPIKNIVKNISGADVYDDNGSLKGSISNCMDELK